jgi:hypothetical protein
MTSSPNNNNQNNQQPIADKKLLSEDNPPTEIKPNDEPQKVSEKQIDKKDIKLIDTNSDAVKEENNQEEVSKKILLSESATSVEHNLSEEITKKNEQPIDKKDNNPIHVTVNVPNEKNKEAKTANKIAIIGLAINILLFTITLFTFKETKRSVDISEKALSDSRIKDSINDIKTTAEFELREKQFAMAKLKDSISNNIALKSLNTQISTFDEASKRFKLENRTYIQVASIYLKDIIAGQQLKVDYGLSNFSKQPVYILIQKYKLVLDKELIYNNLSDLKILSQLNSMFVPSNGNTSMSVIRADITTQNEYSELINNVVSVFLVGEIIYSNNLETTKRKYTFILKINPINNPPLNQSVVLIYNSDSAL